MSPLSQSQSAMFLVQQSHFHCETANLHFGMRDLLEEYLKSFALQYFGQNDQRLSQLAMLAFEANQVNSLDF